MTMEPDTWTAELDSFGTSDDHFSHQQPVRKVASDGTDEKDDAFDGWDSSNWYWDNDFDCLSVSDDSPTEMISVIICSDDEMTESVDNGDGGLEEEEVDESVLTLPLMDGHGSCRDLSNEEYLMQFEQKFSQSTDFGGYNISSVSSSLNSSSDSSLCIVTQAERKDEFWLRQEDKRWNGSEHPSRTKTSSSLADADTGDDYDDDAEVGEKMSSAGHRVRAFDSVDVDCAFAAQHFRPQNPKEPLREFVQMVKENKEMKRKVRKKTSSSKVSSLGKAEKSLFSQTGRIDRNASVEQGTWNDSSFDPGYSNNHSTRKNVLAVFSFSAGLGLVSGLFLGFLTSHYITPFASIADNRKVNEFINCPKPICQSDHQMILNSVWATKYEELVMENADLHLRLLQVKEKFSVDLFQAQHIVGYLTREVGEIRDDFGELEKSSESNDDNVLPSNDSLFIALSSSSFATPQQSQLFYRVTESQSENQSNADLYQLCQTESSLH